LSVILPTWNGGRDLARLLPALSAQDLAGETELVAVDSCSGDDSRAQLARAGARVLTIAQREFGHGRTRNLAAGQAQGEFLVFLSQDALPREKTFTRELIEPFCDPRVAGVVARVLPHDSDDPLTARTVLEAPHAAKANEPVPPFNNVASAIRASVFARLPFPELDFGEDLGWAEAARAAGHRLAFAPRAVVLHAHRYTPLSAFRRYRTDARFHRLQRGLRQRPSLWSALRGLGFEVRADWRFLRQRASRGRWRYAAYSPLLRGAQVLGQYAGSLGPLGLVR
jgi:rhamnosyltransferase